MKKAVFHSVLALVLVAGLTLAMATPVVAEVPTIGKSTVPGTGHPEGVYLIHQDVVYRLWVDNASNSTMEVDYIRDVFAVGSAGHDDSVWDNDLSQWVTWDSEDWPALFTILAGEVREWIVTRTISPDHLEDPADPDAPDAPDVTNQVLIRATVGGELYTDNYPMTVRVIQPAIELTKIVTPSVAGVDDEVEYTFTITNTGDWPLENITLVDDELGDLTAELTPGLILAPHGEEGDSYTFTYEYTIQAGDLPLTNEATVWGTAQDFDPDIDGAVVEHSHDAEVEAKPPPVGGTAHPVSRLALLVPWIVLAGLIAGAAVFVWSRRAQSRA